MCVTLTEKKIHTIIRARAAAACGLWPAQCSTPQMSSPVHDDEEIEAADDAPLAAEDHDAAEIQAAEETIEIEEDGQTAAPKGRGTADPLVVVTRDDAARGAPDGRSRVARRPPRRVITPTIIDGRLVKMTIEQHGNPDLTIDRPSDGDKNDPIFSLWKYADEQRKRADEHEHDARAFADVRALVAKQTQQSRRAGGAGAAGAAAAAAAGAAGARAAGAAMTVFRQPLPPARLPLHKQLPPHLLPVQVGVLGDGSDDDPGARWQVKPLDQALAAEIEARWYLKLTEDTADMNGREFVPSGLKNASFCGGFPHAVCRPKLGPHREKTLYLVGGTHDTRLRVSLHRRLLAAGDAVVSHESEVLGLLRERLPAAEVANWGSFESSIVLYVELQFDQSVADSPAARIDTNAQSEGCAFKSAPENGKLLTPPEGLPYSGGYYEQQMSNGAVCFQFKPNVNITTANLSEPYHAHKFRLSVWCLNPYLNGLSSFQATSLPFAIKSSLHNDLKRAERYVHDDGPGSDIVPCPLDQVAATAAPNRRKRKMAVLVPLSNPPDASA